MLGSTSYGHHIHTVITWIKYMLHPLKILNIIHICNVNIHSTWSLAKDLIHYATHYIWYRRQTSTLKKYDTTKENQANQYVCSTTHIWCIIYADFCIITHVAITKEIFILSTRCSTYKEAVLHEHHLPLVAEKNFQMYFSWRQNCLKHSRTPELKHFDRYHDKVHSP